MLQVVKYLIEGLAVSFASHLVSGGRLDIKEIILLGATAAAVFLVLEHFAPSIAVGARQGAGFGIGYQLVNEGYREPFIDQAGGYYEEEAQPSAEAQAGKGSTNPNKPYKLVDGQYSHKVLLAGFNENAKAYNSDMNCINQEQWPFGSSDDTQEGGAGAGAEAEAGAEARAEAGAEAEAGAGAGAGAEAEESTKKNDNNEILRDNNYRKADVLYSGDLVDIVTDGKYLQRGTIDSQIIFDKPLPKVGTNLSKIRLVHPKHDVGKQTPLSYGEPVYIMHNAYFNNSNLSKFIKYGERLQSHQDGPLFRAFNVYDANNKNRKGDIEPGTELLLSRGDQEGTNVYMKVEADNTVSSKSPQNEATKFTITLKRVYESNDKNLCVCPNDILYP